MANSKTTIDLTGERFGRLSVISYFGNDKYKNKLWLCECDCGNDVIATTSSLRSGNKKSCGCLHKESASKRGKLRKINNEYYVYGNIVFVKFSNCNEYFICDLEDWENLKKYAWYKNDSGYAVNRSFGKTLRFHRLVMGCPDNMEVDHKKRVSDDGICDNRKSNLKIVTRQENSWNLPIFKNNTSGYTGVSWNKSTNKWESHITFNYKTIHLGLFDDIDEAIKARQEAELIYWDIKEGAA